MLKEEGNQTVGTIEMTSTREITNKNDCLDVLIEQINELREEQKVIPKTGRFSNERVEVAKAIEYITMTLYSKIEK